MGDWGCHSGKKEAKDTPNEQVTMITKKAFSICGGCNDDTDAQNVAC